MPLYWAGLCEAVMITPPSQPSLRVIHAQAGVDAMPRSTTLTPPASRPAVSAPRIIGPDVRLSRPTATVLPAPSIVAYALPNSHATRGVSVPPTVPRTPETLTISLSLIALSKAAARGRTGIVSPGQSPLSSSRCHYSLYPAGCNDGICPYPASLSATPRLAGHYKREARSDAVRRYPGYALTRLRFQLRRDWRAHYKREAR